MERLRQHPLVLSPRIPPSHLDAHGFENAKELTWLLHYPG